jgi:hypothetical protein
VSAKTAQLTLHADRPLIVIQEISVRLDSSGLTITPRVIFRNDGKSPAILLDVYLGLKTERGDVIKDLTENMVRQWEYTRHSIQKQVLAAGDTADEIITVKFLHPRVFAEVLHRQTVQIRMALFGGIEVLSHCQSHTNRNSAGSMCRATSMKTVRKN